LKGTKPEDVFVLTRKNAPLYRGKIDLKWVLKFLGEKEITSVLIEGGGAVIGDALERNLVNKMMIYTAPKIMGEGLPSVRGLVPRNLKNVVHLKEMSFDKIGEDILIQGYPKK
jgi:diaminohydroxyphosphoribosylaminopyrimidine deaminase/5-amino-6-(5-phosphoribosylamino)uracil reductase